MTEEDIIGLYENLQTIMEENIHTTNFGDLYGFENASKAIIKKYEIKIKETNIGKVNV